MKGTVTFLLFFLRTDKLPNVTDGVSASQYSSDLAWQKLCNGCWLTRGMMQKFLKDGRCVVPRSGLALALHLSAELFFFLQRDAKAVVTIGMNFSDSCWVSSL